jgi:hypothetical protein
MLIINAIAARDLLIGYFHIGQMTFPASTSSFLWGIIEAGSTHTTARFLIRKANGTRKGKKLLSEWNYAS